MKHGNATVVYFVCKASSLCVQLTVHFYTINKAKSVHTLEEEEEEKPLIFFGETGASLIISLSSHVSQQHNTPQRAYIAFALDEQNRTQTR